MKQRLSSYLLLLFFIPQLGGCANSYPIAKVTLHVVNQDGKPISDTKIEASFWMGRENLSAYPDKEGFVSFQSPVLGDAAFSNEQTYHPIHKPNGKDKYYTTMIRKDFGNRSANVIDGKWQPWNPTIEFVLKEKKNPIPMYVAAPYKDRILPKQNIWIGLDMKRDDWVSPYGKGEHADIEVIHQVERSDEGKYIGSNFKIRFVDQEAGCYSFHYNAENNSYRFGLKSPYSANPNADYTKELLFSEWQDPQTRKWVEKQIPDDVGYIFRTRTRLDASGSLVGAHYGKIYPPEAYLFRPWQNGTSLIRLPFYLNPTENDLNLECGIDMNLHKKSHIPFADEVSP